MVKLFSMFSGYGGAEFALKKADIDLDIVGYSEVDPKCSKCKKITPHSTDGLKMICDVCGSVRHNYAAQCYDQNHAIYYPKGHLVGQKAYRIKNYGDCTKINPDDIPDFDLLTGGFPCQSFSVAGKGLGELDTRGTLFNEIIRVAEVKQPKYMLLENVKGLTNKTHKATFEKILSELNRIGYLVQWSVLNSKEHGIPQNRERVFFVCFHEGLELEFNNFEFPEKEELRIFLKDILEDDVDEKYYLKEELINKLLPHQDVSYCIDANYHKGTNIKGFIDKKRRQIIQVNNPTHSNNRVYSDDGVSPALNTMQGGNRQPFIIASRGRNPKNPTDRTIGSPTEQRLEPKFDGTSNCISTVQKDNWLFNGRIRKLTPTECFRLMGFLNDEIKLEGISNSQRYKLAGNGFDVNLVSKIFTQIIKEFQGGRD